MYLKNSIKQDIYTHIHICVPAETATRWEKLKCPLMDKWKNKMCSVHIMEYYSVFKMKEILTLATIWVSLENTVLSEISRLQKDKYYMIPFMCGI